jgi:hypothetical protein
VPDLSEIGDAIRNGLKSAYSGLKTVGSDLLTGLDALYRRPYLKPLTYGLGIGGALALGGLGFAEAEHALQVANFGGQPLNPVQYLSPVPYSPYYGYSPYTFGLSQSFDTIFNPLTILIVVLVIIIIIMIIMVSKP